MAASSTIRVLQIEDSENDAILTRHELRRAGLSVATTCVDTPRAIREALCGAAWDIVLCDYSLPELDISLVLELLGDLAPGLPIVVVTGAVGEEAVADLMRRGVADVILKDRLSARLAAVVAREVNNARQHMLLRTRRQRNETVLSFFSGAENWLEAVVSSLEYLASNFDAELAVMWELAGPEAIFQPIASWTTPGFAELNAVLRARSLPVGQTRIGRAILSGQSLVVPRIADHSGEEALLPAEASKCGIAGLVCYPLEVAGRRFAISLMFGEYRADLDEVLAELIAISASLQPALFRKIIEYERDLLRDALDATRSGVIITEADTIDAPGPRIVYANRAVSQVSGQSLHDLLGNTPRVFQGPNTNRDTLDRVRQALAAGEPINVELENHRPDGTSFFVELDITPVRDRGRITHFTAIQTDITGRRQAEQERLERESVFLKAELKAEAELRRAKDRAEEAEALLHDALDSLSEGFVIYDREDRFVMCNSVYRRIYAESAGLLVPGTPFKAIISETDDAAVEDPDASLARRRRREGGATFEERMRDGTWILVTDRRMRNGGFAGLRVDITALKHAQMALAESEARLDRAQEIAGIGSWELEVATGQLFWSKGLFRMRGLSPEEFRPSLENIASYMHPDDYPLFRRWVDTLCAGLEQGTMEARIIRPDGEVRTIRIEGRAVADSNCVVHRVTGTIQDITERRDIERQLVQAQKMEAIGNLTGGMAHDFNNMLGIILVNLEMLRKLTAAETIAAELCDEAIDGANRCANVVRRLLAFARRQPLHPEPTDVNAWIKDVARLLGRTLGEDITIALRLDEQLWPVMVDPVQFEATLVNLATNARDAMPAGGELRITTRNMQIDEVYLALHPDAAAGDYVLVEISDTGTGIPPDIIGRIFEPFFTTKAVGAGTGLGLSMAFGFAKQSGGHLSVYSEPGLGATFKLHLRRCTAAGEAPSIPTAAPAATGGHEIVLAVEDNDQLRRAMVRQLKELGYSVREADRAASAMAILETGDPVDLLFTDVVMPGKMDGLELAYQASRQRPNLKVLLASGFPGMRGDEHRTANNPFPLLNKPYNREQIARAIRGGPGQVR